MLSMCIPITAYRGTYYFMEEIMPSLDFVQPSFTDQKKKLQVGNVNITLIKRIYSNRRPTDPPYVYMYQIEEETPVREWIKINSINNMRELVSHTGMTADEINRAISEGFNKFALL